MNKHKKLKLSILLIVMIAITAYGITYLIYDAHPRKFPNNKVVIDNLNKLYPEVSASKVQAIIPLDEHHVFVPFISSNEDYGVSYWVWKKFQWKLAQIHTTGEPHVWKLKSRDPSTHYIIWNMDPKDQIKDLKFYLTGQRNYIIHYNNSRYLPRVQKETTIPLGEQSYGTLQLPVDWVQIINPNVSVTTPRQPSLFPFYNNGSSTYNPLSLGWISYNEQGESTLPNSSFNNRSYGMSDIDVDYIPFVNEPDLE